MNYLPPSEVVTSQTDGAKYIVFSTVDFISNEIKKEGTYGGLQRFCHALLKDKAPGIIVDIGCNLGSFTIPLALRYPEHKFHCFDVQRVVLNQFCGALALNGLLNVYPRHIGLSNSSGLVVLQMPNYATDSNVGAFSLDDEVNDRFNFIASRSTNIERVEINTLDQHEFNDVRLIKIDVEGLELKVLQGGWQTLKRNHYPPILLEVWDDPWEVERRKTLLAWLEDLGYQIYPWGPDSIAQHPAYGEIVSF
jgi:FkbM family methyltransferase